MTREEKQKILVALMQVNSRNFGNRITEDVANGISVTFGQFLDSMIAEAENAAKEQAKDAAPEGAKE